MLEPNLSLPEAPPQRRGHPLIAWVIILGIVALIVWRNQAGGQAETQAREQSLRVLLRMQGRMIVALGDLMEQKKQAVEQARKLDRGPPEQRLRSAVLVGELEGPAAARRQLEDLLHSHEKGSPLPPALRQLAHLLLRLYAGFEKHPKEEPDLTAAQQEELRRQLGWFGGLAVAPPRGPDPQARQAVLSSARRALMTVSAVTAFLLFALFAGLMTLVVAAALWLSGRLDGGLTTGVTPGGIYAETFALYLLLFLGLSYAFHFVPATGLRPLLSAAAILGSLAALAWPLLRGVSWQQLRRDLGLFVESRREPLYGVGCYLAAVPVLAVGVLIIYGIDRLRQPGAGGEGPGSAPIHPLVGEVHHGGWRVWLQLLVAASVVAPLVEETLFRGVLYRHLREASRRWGPVLSVLASALFSSFLFAAIHPQGLVAVPALMGLACVFCLVREWRGSLLPSMIAHGINNGVITGILVLMAS